MRHLSIGVALLVVLMAVAEVAGRSSIISGSAKSVMPAVDGISTVVLAGSIT